MDTKHDFRKMIIDFVRDNPSHPQLQFILEDEFHLEELNDKGLVNYVLRVSSGDKVHSIIVKYGEEKFRVSSPDIVQTLPLTRQQVEFDSLILLANICPGSAPLPYCYDKKHQIIAMEDLHQMKLLGVQLSKGLVNVEVAPVVGKLFATIHNKTSRQLLPPEEWKLLENKFIQQELKDETKNFVQLFNENSPKTDIPDGGLEVYQKAVEGFSLQGLLDKLVALLDMNECFIHADCHWNHVAISPSSERVSIFDFEKAYIGHPSYNMACVIQSYPLFFHAMPADDIRARASFCEAAKVAVIQIVDAYLAETEIYKEPEHQSEFLSTLALCTGCKIFTMAVFDQLDQFFSLTSKQRIVVMRSGGRVMLKHMEIHTSKHLAEALFWEPTDDLMS